MSLGDDCVAVGLANRVTDCRLGAWKSRAGWMPAVLETTGQMCGAKCRGGVDQKVAGVLTHRIRAISRVALR